MRMPQPETWFWMGLSVVVFFAVRHWLLKYIKRHILMYMVIAAKGDRINVMLRLARIDRMPTAADAFVAVESVGFITLLNRIFNESEQTGLKYGDIVSMLNHYSATRFHHWEVIPDGVRLVFENGFLDFSRVDMEKYD